MSFDNTMSENQKALLEAVGNGNVESVRGMLLADDLLEYDYDVSSPLPNINALDEQNQSALSIAVKSKDLDMVSLLLECGANVQDALLLSVETGCEPLVRLILEHLKENKSALETLWSTFVEDKDYLTPTTPLMYAARRNYHDIVKLLVEFGATIPDLEVVLNRTQRDQYKDASACLYWHQVIASESYLIYVADDPIQSAINAGKLVQKNKQTLLQHRKAHSQEIMDNLDGLITKYMEVAKDGEEIENLIWNDVPGGVKKIKGRGVLPRRIRDALKLEFKQFISSQTCSHFLRDQWYGTWINLYGISFIIWTVLVVLGQPLICLLYLLLPFQSKRKLVQTPYVRFLLYFVSKLCFVGFLLYLNISWVFIVADDSLRYCQLKFWFTDAPIAGYFIFYAWLLGMTWKTVRDMWASGATQFWTNAFNWTDTLQIILYWISVGLFWTSFTYQNSPDILNAWDRYINIITGGTVDCLHEQNIGVVIHDDQSGAPSENITATNAQQSNASLPTLVQSDLSPLVLSDVFFGVATILSFLNLFRELVGNFFVGPLRVSLGGMIGDIVRFSIIFTFVWISFAMGMRQVYQSYNVITALHCLNPEGCERTPFEGLVPTMEALFWSMFNPLDTSSLHVNEELKMIGIIGEILYAIYMVVVVVVMLNALIAMMAESYERVAQNRETEWKVERVQMMAYYMHRTTTLPPPFNVIPTVYSIIKFVTWPCRKNKEKLRQLEEIEMRRGERQHDSNHGNYETFIKTLNERYANLYFADQDEDDADVTHSHDIQQMKTEIAQLREGLHDIQTELLKNQQILQNLASYMKGSENRRGTFSFKKK